MATHAHDAFELHEFTYGHPSHPMPLHLRMERVHAGEVLPAHRASLGIITPPSPGRCCHCGAVCDDRQHVRQHAVADYEYARHPESRELLRFLVTHCDECLDSDACRADRATPGSGHSDAPGGWCEGVPTEMTLGISLFPGARYAAKFAGLVLSAAGVWLLSHLAIQTSQGQMQANLGGPLANLIVPGTATSGQGFNAGLLRVLSGSAPATANAAETGTLGISWSMPATAFGAASAALPSVTTANAISNVTISNTITAGYARLVENADSGFGLSTTLRRFQFAVGTSGSDLNLNTLSLVVSGTASCTALSITHGA